MKLLFYVKAAIACPNSCMIPDKNAAKK